MQDNIAERECCGVPCKCIGTRGDRGGVGLPGFKVSKPFNSLYQKQNCLQKLKPGCFVFQGSPGFQGSQGHPGDEGGPVSLNALLTNMVTA